VDRCMPKVILDPGSLRRRELCPAAFRYDYSTSTESADIPTLVQMWCTSPAEMPRILLFDGVPSRWSSLSAPYSRTPRTGAILDDRIFSVLVRRHVLESGAGKFYSGGDHEALWVWRRNAPSIFHLNSGRPTINWRKRSKDRWLMRDEVRDER